MSMSIRKLKRSTAKKQKYLKYYEDAKREGKHPLTYAEWLKSREPVYFRGLTKKTAEARLKEAGIDWERDRPSKRLKRSK